jgi:NAD(P)-dependent dehydrogenase (short-subunit alcohol dehydrogenase family)
MSELAERSCEGRVALVTGASRGIGRAVAIRLAAEGADVAICSRPTPGFENLGTLARARDELANLGGRVVAIPFDLATADPPRAALIDQVEDELGPVDILVNNAAAGSFRRFMDWTDGAMATILELNFWAPWHLIRRVLPGMRERGAGWIVNMSSQTAVTPVGPPFPATHPSTEGTLYGGSKAFLNRWTASLAAEVYGEGIAVNALAPEAAAATEVLVEYSDLAAELYEPLETMAEATLALCSGDPDVLTGRVTTSLELLVDLQRPVRDLAGMSIVPGWQPADLPPKIEVMRQHARGERGGGPSNVDRVMEGRVSS